MKTCLSLSACLFPHFATPVCLDLPVVAPDKLVASSLHVPTVPFVTCSVSIVSTVKVYCVTKFPAVSSHSLTGHFCIVCTSKHVQHQTFG